jgi:hypothetical protein
MSLIAAFTTSMEEKFEPPKDIIRRLMEFEDPKATFTGARLIAKLGNKKAPEDAGA